MSSLPQVKYTGSIREIKLGEPGKEVTVGGETAYNFYSFEGAMPHAPRLALQVLDIEPEEWAAEAVEPFKDVIGDPVAWAKKCVDEYKADLVCLWLAGTDPNGKDLSPEHAAETAKKVAEAVDVPLIVWGVSSDEKNIDTLKAVCEACEGKNLTIGPVTENNYKQIGAAALAYKHTVVANSPIDINLAKQLNILLENLGVPEDRIIIDPTTGSVGYGMEYCYSIMERIRQSALTQNDAKLQYPILNNVAEEVWKTKEAKLKTEEDPNLGDAATRAINLEAITAVSCLQAGSDILILRHPKTLEHVRKYVSSLMTDLDLESMNVDMSLAAEAPKAAAPAPKAAPAKPAPKAAAKPPAKKPEPPKPVAKKEEPAKPAAKKEEAPPLKVVEREKPAAAAPKAPEPKKEEPKPAAAAAASTGEGVDISQVEFTQEEIEALRSMIATFKSLKNVFSAFAKVMSGEIK